jgi:NTE family protein
MAKMGLVLQGGGGLGAYEYGAVTRLVERGWQPAAITGVSIGAITAAAVAGARDGDICASLKRLWDAITLLPVPFVPPERQAAFSLFGNPNFWRARTDYLSLPEWTSLCDVSPMAATLEAICDFARLNDPTHIRLSVTATNVLSGAQVSFANHVAPSLRAKRTVTPVVLTARHILASGSLPPGFPPTVIDGVPYWDGGLFDNTPIAALLDLLAEDEIADLPIFVVDLFPSQAAAPQTLAEVLARMLEIAYENRFGAEFADPAGDLAGFTGMLAELGAALPADSPIRASEAFQRLLRLAALKNLRTIAAPHTPMTGGMDFSSWGVSHRFEAGRAAVDRLLDGKISGEAAGAAP